MGESIDTSVVIPLFNEVESLEELHTQLGSVFDEMGSAHEFLFVDDGSTDGSRGVLAGLAAKDDHVVVIELQRNFGKAAALDAGFRAARGSVVITLDADLQDEPREIPKLMNRLNEGFDLVCGWKKDRRDPPGKRIPSKIFNWMARRVSGLKLHDFNCGLKVYRREVVEDLALLGEMHRFIPVLAHGRGYRVTEQVVEHHARIHGRSKYGSSRFIKALFDLMTVLLTTRYDSRPLHLFGGTGLLLSSLGFAILLYLSIWKWLDPLGRSIGDRPILFLGLLLLVIGVQFVCTGLVAELLVRRETADRKFYVVRTITRPEAGNEDARTPIDHDRNP